MPIVSFQVQHVECDAICDECNRGYMRPTGMVVRGEEGQTMYVHRCFNCDSVKNFHVTYPHIKITRGKQL